MKAIFHLKTTFLFSALLCFSILAKAQTYTITGKLLSSDKTAVPDAIIQLLKSTDSSLVKTEFADDKGNFSFTETKQGSYIIQTNELGYKNYLSSPIDVNNSIQLPEIALQKSEVELKEVAVVARKPYIVFRFVPGIRHSDHKRVVEHLLLECEESALVVHLIHERFVDG